MARFYKKTSDKLGQRPGTVSYIGDSRDEPVKIQVLNYQAEQLTETAYDRIEDTLFFKEVDPVTWINITGIHDIKTIEKIGEQFGVHPLALEDIVNTGLRPKFEETDEYIFISLKMLYLNSHNKIKSEQVSILFGQSFVITFQEVEQDVFEPVRNRIRKTVPRSRFLQPDYLAYTLIDAIVDHYFVILESLGSVIEEVELDLMDNPTADKLEVIHELKRELILFRKPVWPLRELVGAYERSDSKLRSELTQPYIRDLYEHVIQVIDTIETYREMVSGLLDIYLSSVSNRMNEVMKVLTIIATIFIPLGFLAGVYGMNFDTSISPFNLPELGMKFGYIFFWLAVLVIGGGLAIFFKRKKWL